METANVIGVSAVSHGLAHDLMLAGVPLPPKSIVPGVVTIVASPAPAATWYMCVEEEVGCSESSGVGWSG